MNLSVFVSCRPFPLPGSSAFCRYTDGGAALGTVGTHYIQGFVSLLPTSEATGGNIVLTGSHKRWSELAAKSVAAGWSTEDAVERERPPAFTAFLCSFTACQCLKRCFVPNFQGSRPDYAKLLAADPTLAATVSLIALQVISFANDLHSCS